MKTFQLIYIHINMYTIGDDFQNDIIEVHWPSSLRAVSPFYPLPHGVSSARYIDSENSTILAAKGSVDMYIYIYMYIYFEVYIYAYIYIYIYIYVYIYIPFTPYPTGCRQPGT
jgi:hypothetical protein